MKNNKNKNWETIHEETSKMSKWIALYEAINILADKAEEKGIQFKNLELKPLAIKKYINSTEDIIYKKLLKNDYNIDVCYDENIEENCDFKIKKY